jgi:hypothetical protein
VVALKASKKTTSAETKEVSYGFEIRERARHASIAQGTPAAGVEVPTKIATTTVSVEAPASVLRFISR